MKEKKKKKKKKKTQQKQLHNSDTLFFKKKLKFLTYVTDSKLYCNFRKNYEHFDLLNLKLLCVINFSFLFFFFVCLFWSAQHFFRTNFNATKNGALVAPSNTLTQSKRRSPQSVALTSVPQGFPPGASAKSTGLQCLHGRGTKPLVIHGLASAITKLVATS